MILTILLLGGCNNTSSSLPYVDFRDPSETTFSVKDPHAQRPILIALATVISPNETIAYYRKIADYISRKTGRPTLLVQRRTYAEINMLLANGNVDIAFLSTGAYSSYRGMNEIEILAMAEHNGTTLYDTDIIVQKDSDIHSLHDLRNKVFAFTDPLSHSGHMVMEQYLWEKGMTPSHFFKRYFYTYSHDKALWAVANKIADAASFDSQIYEYMKIHDPRLAGKVRIIATIGTAPTGPVVIRKNMSTKDKENFRNIFLSMQQDPETSAAMKRLLIDRFVPPTPNLYNPLKKLYEQTSVAP
jgi:phosphonate transport system substrate-binding protein